ncbi:12796_t:CDS:2, partial [Racocetra persica]
LTRSAVSFFSNEGIVKVDNISKFGINNAEIGLAESNTKRVLAEDKDAFEEYKIRKPKTDESRFSLVSKTNDESVKDWFFIIIDEDDEILEMIEDKCLASELLLKRIICKHNHRDEAEDIGQFKNEIKKFDKETKAYVDILQTGFLNYIVYSHRFDKEKKFNHAEVENVANVD